MVVGCCERGNEIPGFIKGSNLFILEPKSASQTGLFHNLVKCLYTLSQWFWSW